MPLHRVVPSLWVPPACSWDARADGTYPRALLPPQTDQLEFLIIPTVSSGVTVYRRVYWYFLLPPSLPTPWSSFSREMFSGKISTVGSAFLRDIHICTFTCKCCLTVHPCSESPLRLKRYNNWSSPRCSSVVTHAKKCILHWTPHLSRSRAACVSQSAAPLS